MAISFLQVQVDERLGEQPSEQRDAPAERLAAAAAGDDRHTDPDTARLEVPAGFSLRVCVRRSPLAQLAPVRWREGDGPQATGALRLVLSPAATGHPALVGAAPREVVLTQPGGAGTPLWVRGLGAEPALPAASAASALLGQLRGMLRLDEDHLLFYRLASEDPELVWAPALDAARALRSATAFEDLAKCLLLGGASEARAVALCEALCALGAPLASGHRAFPQAAELCAVSVEELRGLGLGRLARPLHELATLCASGTLHAEALRREPGRLGQALAAAEDADDEASWDDLVGEELEWQERVRSLLEWLPGFGEQAVGEMQLLLGCYEDVQLHRRARSAFRHRFPPKSRRRPPEPPASKGSVDETDRREAARQQEVLLIRRLLRRLEPYGLYRGLAQALLTHEGLRDEAAAARAPGRAPNRAANRAQDPQVG